MSRHARLVRRARPLMLALAVGFPSMALAAPAAAPSAGSILQQVQPSPQPPASSDSTGLSIEPPPPVGALPDSAPFRIERIEITGASQIDGPTLHALVADKEGRDLTLSDLGAAAARITDYYRAHGYPLARAIVPAQTIQAGIARIEVIEARYGEIGLDNRSRVDDGLLRETLGRLHSGAVVTQSQMDRSLLLLSDIPGVVVDATLKPGAAVGASDLQVKVMGAPLVAGHVAVDNGGDRYTGRARVSATVNLINPLRHGDVLSLSGLSSGSRTNYGRLSYETLLDGEGTRLGGSYSALGYKLGGPLASLEADGRAEVASLWARRPVVRGRAWNLYGQVQYDHLKLIDDIGVSSIHNARHLDTVTATLFGDVGDKLLGGGVSNWNASWTRGEVGFDDASARLSDDVTAGVRGDFSRWNLNLARLQRLGASNVLYLSFAGQWASGNLDSSQKMIAGGPYGVRAYDVGAASGDVGYLFTAEVRRSLPKFGPGQWQAIAFFDSQHLTVNKARFVAGPNHADLSGAGAGVKWAGSRQLSFAATVAAPVGHRPQLAGPTAGSRAWLTLSKVF